MKKRGLFLIYFLTVSLLIPLSFSAGDLVFSDTVEDRDAVVIEGVDFEFRIDRSGKALIEVDTSGIIIANGECKVKNKFNICVKNISFSYRNLTTYFDVYKALVDVYQSKSTLDITISMDNENILVDEEVNGEIAFENSADVSSESVKSTLSFPSNLLLTNVESCKQSGNSIIFEDNVHTKQIRKCLFTVKGISPGDFEFKTDASFFDGIAQSTASSNEVEGKVYNHSLYINHDFSRSSFNIKEKFNLTVTIENINPDYDIIVTAFNMKIPDNVMLINKPKDTSGTTKLIVWSGNLESEANKSFLMELQALNTGDYSIDANAGYKVSKFLRNSEENIGFKVECDCPYIDHEFSQKIVVPEQRAVLKAALINPGKESFKNVRISYSSDVPGINDYSTAYNIINPNEAINIFGGSVIAPAFGEYRLNITIAYESSSNEVFVVKDNIPIRVQTQEIKQENMIEVNASVTEDTNPVNVSEEQEEESVSAAAETNENEVKEGESFGEEQQQEIIVTTLEDEKRPIMAYVVVGFIFGLILIGGAFVILKRRKSEALEPPEKAEKPEASSIDKELKGLEEK